MINRNILCFKYGDVYGPEYVNNLYYGVQRYLNLAHRFVCVTDCEEGIDPAIDTCRLDPVYTESELQGHHSLFLNFNRMRMFAPVFHDLRGTVLLLDLDTVIVGSLDDVFDFPGYFLAMQDCCYDEVLGMACLRFNIGEQTWLWEMFKRDRLKLLTIPEVKEMFYFNACVSPTLLPVTKYRRIQKLFPSNRPQRAPVKPFPGNWFQGYPSELEKHPENLRSGTKFIVFWADYLPHNADNWVRRLWLGNG